MDFLDRIFLRILGIHLHRASIGARALTRSANLTRVTLLPTAAAILNVMTTVWFSVSSMSRGHSCHSKRTLTPQRGCPSAWVVSRSSPLSCADTDPRMHMTPPRSLAHAAASVAQGFVPWLSQGLLLRACHGYRLPVMWCPGVS